MSGRNMTSQEDGSDNREEYIFVGKLETVGRCSVTVLLILLLTSPLWFNAVGYGYRMPCKKPASIATPNELPVETQRSQRNRALGHRS